MQMALEALEDANDVARMEFSDEDYYSEAINALRQALEQPAQQEPVATVVKRQYEDGTYAGNALDWAGRNCEDDFPVGAKLYTDPQPVKFNCTVVDDDHPNGVPLSQWKKQQKQKPFCYHDGRNIVGKEYAHHCDVFPLYTEQQPEQEPLTDEEFISMLDSAGLVVDPELAFEIKALVEAAHGITGEKK
jgi:hypothetical protein